MNLTPRSLLFAVVAVLLVAPLSTQASKWSGTGELGFAVARGNSESENLNGKLGFVKEDEQWKYKFGAAGLRAKGTVTGDFDGDGDLEERSRLSANRFQLDGSAAFKMNERAYWLSALRFENDDFAPFDEQSTLSMSFGYTAIQDQDTKLSAEVGPGYRRARNTVSGETESDLIFRGALDFSQKLTGNTELVNKYLVESGSDNTFMQNDLGVVVAMNASLALKAGLQLRHNSEVQPGAKQTDSLSTLNLVYNFK